MKYCFYSLLVLLSSLGFSQKQDQAFSEEELSVSKWIDGTLLIPTGIEKPNLAIIIAGSGPTNRDGNQNFLKNNALKKLATSCANNGIATFRYDKRIVKQIKQNAVDPNIMFDDFVDDAATVIQYFKSKENFNKIYVVGHSQGSLVGMLAAQGLADGFVSLEGAGKNIGDVLVYQVKKSAPMFAEDTERIVESLKAGNATTDYPPELKSIFSEEIQPFMINWMFYNPQDSIKALDIPVLIINGTKDLQVSVQEAELLKAANSSAKLVIIPNMNHVLFEIEGDELENSKSYNESFRTISPKLVEHICDFIKS